MTDLLIVTDGSIFLPTLTGAWAGCAARGGAIIDEASGLLLGDIKSSMSSEMHGVANMLLHATSAGYIVEGEEVTLVCDNLAVVNGVAGKWRVKKPDCQTPYRTILEMITRHKLLVRTKHINGHTKLPGLMYDMNRRCDELCGPLARAEHERRLAARLAA